MNDRLIRIILRRALENDAVRILYSFRNHKIPSDNVTIKQHCDWLQDNGYLEGAYFGNGLDEPNLQHLGVFNAFVDDRIYLGQVTPKGRNLLEKLNSQE